MNESATGVITRVNPLTQVTTILVATILGLMFGPVYLGFFYCIALLICISVKKARTFLLISATALLPAAVTMFALQFFFTQSDDVIVRWWVFTGTTAGLHNAVKFVTRFLVIGTGVLLLSQVLDLQRFSRDLEQRGISRRSTYVVQSTFLIIPEMQKRGSVILDAQRARGIETDLGLRSRLKALLPAIAPLILSSLAGVEERAISLEARGMSLEGPKTSLLHVPDRTFDKALRILAYVLLVSVLSWKTWLWLK